MFQAASTVAMEAWGGNIADKDFILSMDLQNKIIFRDNTIRDIY